MSGHIILLGDSILDNGAYVPGQPDVVVQLEEALPPHWSASLLAVDGDVTSGVARQLRRLPRSATHLVVSAGGNDALGHSSVLTARPDSVAGALTLLADALDRFAADYEAMLDGLVETGLPVAVCTIYDTPTTAPQHRAIATGIALFNDRITRAAFHRGVPLIDLRLVCDDDGDYANPIEPSAQGGAKIAAAIAALVTGAARSRSVVETGNRRS
ncbi:MAG TPA: SGNH/GDSL hydrolase family protein [Naasia sp.]|jgi:lysophospholipase L1-like esterase